MTENVPQRLDGSEGLTTAEGLDLARHERKIRKAMHMAGETAGDSLRDIRDRRLYRAGYDTFESYCRDQFGFSRSTGYRMIEVAKEKAARHELTAPGLSHETSETAGQGTSGRDKGSTSSRGLSDPITTTAAPVPDPAEHYRNAEPVGELAPADRAVLDDLVGEPSPHSAAPTVVPPSSVGGPPTARQSVAQFLAMLRSYDPAELGAAMTAEETAEVRDFAAGVRRAGQGVVNPPPLRSPLIRGGQQLAPRTSDVPRNVAGPPPKPKRHAPGCTCLGCAEAKPKGAKR